jgi:hypothetical protein
VTEEALSQWGLSRQKETIITDYLLNLALYLLIALAAESYLAVRRRVTFKYRQVCLP